MAIATNGVQLVRIAGAVFNQQLSASDYSEILTSNKSAAELDAWANAAVAAEFKNKTTKDVAAALLSNVGLSSVAGLENWVTGQLNAGGGLSKAGATILGMLNDFSNMTADATYGTAATTFNSKVTNAQALSQTAGTATGTYAAVSSAAPVSNFTLTTGVDLRTAGTGDDTYTTVNTSTSQTLNAGDNVNGGAGNDTLNITSTSALAAGTGVTSSGFETVSITATGGAFSLDATSMSGITAITNSGSTGAAVTVTGLTSKVAVNLTGANDSTTITHAAAAVAGTADSLALTLNGANTTTSGTLTVNGFETINVNAAGATGSSSTALTISDDSLQTLAVTGAGASAIVATFNGAAGIVVATATGGDGAETLTVTPGASGLMSVSTGAGNDRVNIASIVSTHTINGGDGTDTLNTSASITTTTGANISNFETVRVSGGATVALPSTNTVATFTIADAGGGTLTNLAASGTVNLTTGGAATVTNTTGWTGSTDAITVNVGAASGTGSTGSGTASSVSAALIETATINNLQASTDTNARTVGVSGASLKTLNVVSSGTAAITITGGSTTSALTAVDASAVNGVVSNTATMATAGFSLTTGSAADALSGGTGTDTLIGGAGNDTLTGNAGVDRLTGGTGADRFVFGANAAGSVVSSVAAPDVITDFVSGTDKLQITQSVTAFLNNYTTLASAQAAAAADGRGNLAYYVTNDNTLYVASNVNGVASSTDTAISFTAGTVTSLTAADLLLGAQGTGNAITLTLGSAPVVNTTSSNATSSVLTTALDDTITAVTGTTTAATSLLGTGAAIDGGTGVDVLNITASANAQVTSLTTASGNGVAVTNVETVNLTVTATAAANALSTLPATLTTLTATGTDGNGAITATFGATGQTITVTNTAATTGSTITFGNFPGVASGVATQTVTTGSGADTFNTIAVDGISITAGPGNDQFNASAVAAFDNDSLAVTLAGGTGTDTLTFANGLTGTIDLSDTNDVTISGIESIDAGTATTGGMAITLAGSDFRTIAGDTTTANVTYTMTSAQLEALTTITAATTANTFSVVVSNTAGPLTVDLSDTTYTTLGAVDSITYDAVLTGVVTATIDENVTVVGGRGTTDVLNVTGSLGAVTMGSSAFETVNLTTTAQASAVTLGAGVLTVNSSLTQTGAITIVSGTTAANATAGNITYVDTNTAANTTTFTNSGSGAMTVTMTADTRAADTVVNSGTGSVTVAQKVNSGATTVTLNANSAVDTINFSDGTTASLGVLNALDKVTVTGFNTSGDIITLDIEQTSVATTAGSAPVVSVVAAAGAFTWASGTADVIIFNYDQAGTTEVLSADATGAALIFNVGTITAAASTDETYVVAYDNSKAYIYQFTAATDTTVTAAKVVLIGVINGAEVGSLGASDFTLSS